MGIYTSTSPFVSTFNQGRARNAALLPEATLRSERILEVASQEMENATNYYPLEGEYYRRRKSGRQCTCQRESIDRNVENKEEAGVSLSDFLVSLNEGLKEEDFCPICFGTGLVGGYERTGTANITLDSTLNPTLDKINVIQQSPYYFKPTNKWGTITWSLVVPKYFTDVLNVAIKWKEEPDQWTLKVDESTITKDSFLNEKGNSIDIEFSMKDSTNKEAGIYAIFIQLSVSNSCSIRCDIPRKIIDYTGEFNIFDAPESNVTINFDNTVKNLTTRDLLVDDEGYIWRIVRVERGNPMSVDIFKTCESRLVRRFEKYYQIPSKKIISKYYSEDNAADSLYTWVL